MGWWRIDNVERGQIDFERVLKEKSERPYSANVRPGADDPSAMYNGDGPADVMGDALRRIAEMYKEVWGRGPKADELHACVNFCANPWINDEGVFEPWNDPRKR